MTEPIEFGLRDPLLRVQNLSKHFVQRKAFSGSGHTIHALEQASLTVSRGSTLALVGDSGSGKSTLARCLALLEEPSAGQIWFDGRNLNQLTSPEL